MAFNIIRIFYWASFVLSIIILPLNFGLVLAALAILILPILIIHLKNGIWINQLRNHKLILVVAATNLLVFALIRPDGVHDINGIGFSALLDVFSINGGYNHEYFDLYFYGSLALLAFQLIINLIIWSIRVRGRLVRNAK